MSRSWQCGSHEGDAGDQIELIAGFRPLCPDPRLLRKKRAVQASSPVAREGEAARCRPTRSDPNQIGLKPRGFLLDQGVALAGKLLEL